MLKPLEVPSGPLFIQDHLFFYIVIKNLNQIEFLCSMHRFKDKPKNILASKEIFYLFSK